MIGLDPSYAAPIAGFLALIVVGVLAEEIRREDPGTEKMRRIASYIEEGARAFLSREFKTITYFIIPLCILLWIFLRWEISLGFILGAVSSLLAAYIGMMIAVKANVRTASASIKAPERAVMIAFRGGGVTGLSIIGMSLLGLGILYILYNRDPELLVGYGFGASLAALFAQLGGGIYTKAADVGADLVGKIEARIPEDDPRNPAVIADQVGDNVGDCAGRGADLFESFSDNIIGVMIVGLAFTSIYGYKAVIFPMLIESISIVATIIGIFLVREGRDPIRSVYTGFFSTGILCIIGFYLVSVQFMHDIRLFYCTTLGLLTSLIIALLVLYYTKTGGSVTRRIAAASQSGAAINLIIGLSYGLESAVPPVILVALVVVASYLILGGGLQGIYGISASTVGILSTTGIIMASDTFGPIADNAQGIAEMAGEEDLRTAESLDSVGNVTKAITKGYAMTCCILTAIVILFAYMMTIIKYSGMTFTLESLTVNIIHPKVICAIFLGAALPFIFSALAIRAVGKTSFQMVEEVRRQFREIPGLLEGRAKPDYSTCVDISTRNALREMILPTLLSLTFPIIVGFIFNVWALAAYLIAVSIVSSLLAIFMFNSGGAFDNAKKYIEMGHFGGKGSPAHAASVIGDTVGDPLKDCAGPSLHILVKLQNILSITMLPILLQYALHW
ncbi:sodium-translocating pyrophosphatase [Candidatus Bathyarchaeota archaeon]|nr:sodium-translocating pyrophosphatase [Candidatus Bathyarchaeota archaeon]